MFLWKFIIVFAALMSFAWALARPLAATRLEALQLVWLCAVGIANIGLMLSTAPYGLVMAVLGVSFFVLWQFRVPPLLSYLFLVAILPLMEQQFGDVGAITTLLVLDVTVVASLAVLLLLLIRPELFRKLSFGLPDLAVLVFILLYAGLGSRHMPGTTIVRECAEGLIVYGGAYFAASRLPVRRPRTLFAGMLFTALFLAFISVFEAGMHWPLYADTRDMFKGAGFTVRFGLLRSVGPSIDPLAFSLMQAYFAMSLVGVWMLSKRKDSMFLIAVILSAGVLALGILVTGARTGLLGTGAALVTLAFMRRRLHIALGLLALLVVGMSQLTAPDVDQHLADTADYRVRLLYEVPARMTGDLWIGDPQAVEPGRQLEDLRQGQGIVDLVNTYLQMFVNGGLVLLIAFMALIAVVFASYVRFRRIRQLAPETKVMMTVALLQFVLLLAGLTVTSLTDKNLFFLMVAAGVIVGLQRSSERLKGKARTVMFVRARDPTKDGMRWPASTRSDAV